MPATCRLPLRLLLGVHGGDPLQEGFDASPGFEGCIDGGMAFAVGVHDQNSGFAGSLSSPCTPDGAGHFWSMLGLGLQVELFPAQGVLHLLASSAWVTSYPACLI